MEFRNQTLDNGLQVIAECNPNAYSSAFGFFVNTGSRDETDVISGVSHFLEHMVFKGTPKRTAADVNRELDEIGSQSNAYTSEEHTVYYASVLPEFQANVVDLLGDIMRPSLRKEDFEVEKKVILEEIAKYEDQPPFGATDKCMAAHFVGHPLGRSVLGTAESVTALTATQMRDYFNQRYSPGNITLAASGKVDFDALVAQAAKISADWQPFTVRRETPRAAARSAINVIEKAQAVQQYAVQIANGPAAMDEDRYACRLLATVLGDDSGSRMFWELVDTGEAEYASIGTYEFQGTGIQMTFLCCAPEDCRANLGRIHELQESVEQNGITEDELERAKSKVCSSIVLRAERSANRMFGVGSGWLQRREYTTVRESVDRYKAVTVADIVAVVEKHPYTTNTTVVVGPLTDLQPLG
ncbi:MAG TPA: pitrilysin family protein [Pirellulaceae bacterium]|nr:pitrilysin family protein [Pirellulaceae bacterium]